MSKRRRVAGGVIASGVAVVIGEGVTVVRQISEAD